MTQHINPGTDTTINPVVKPNKWFLVNDIEMREFFNAWMYSSKSPKQLHEVYDPILARELNHLCGYCERPFDKHNLPCPHLMMTKLGELIVQCAHFKPRGPIDWAAHTSAPAHPPEAQQRIEQVIKELENDINRLSQRQQTQYRCGEISEAKRAIALLQAGRK